MKVRASSPHLYRVFVWTVVPYRVSCSLLSIGGDGKSSCDGRKCAYVDVSGVEQFPRGRNGCGGRDGFAGVLPDPTIGTVGAVVCSHLRPSIWVYLPYWICFASCGCESVSGYQALGQWPYAEATLSLVPSEASHLRAARLSVEVYDSVGGHVEYVVCRFVPWWCPGIIWR